MSKRLLSLGCWLMAVVLPFHVIAADAGGRLSSVGTVLVDSRRVAASGVVFVGDIIETKAQSNAIVTTRGVVMSLGENSNVRLDNRAFELQSGAMVVSSTSSVVRVENFTITADSATPSKFLARKINGELQVLALEGTVSVSDGQETTQVPATKGAKFPKIGKPSWLTNDDIGILIIVASAITAGVIVGVVNSQNAKPASPSGP